MGAIFKHSNAVISKLHVASPLEKVWLRCHKTPIYDLPCSDNYLSYHVIGEVFNDTKGKVH